MPFEDELTTIYEGVVKPVVESKGLFCQRAADYRTNKEIMKEIWTAICQSQVVIAEMTGLNPNVMYELGISHTVARETIMMTQNLGKNQEFPFDMAHIRRIQYQNTVAGYPRLKDDLSMTLDFVIKQITNESLTYTEDKDNYENQYLLIQAKRQIERLKMEGIATIYPERKLKSIDALKTYGKPAIDAIMDVVSSTPRTERREHGLDAIRKIQESNHSRFPKCTIRF